MDEVTITRLGHLGDGIADGPVYVPRVLPGEVVRGRLEGNTLRDIAIVTPSDRRVAAPCRHYASCGGCLLQHADDSFVADWKAGVLKEALRAQGLETDVRPVLTSPPETRRRAGFAARRTKKGVLAGFHGRASDTIVPVPECRILLPEVRAGLKIAEALAQEGASRKATLSVSVSAARPGLDILVQGGKPLDGPLRLRLAQICENLGIARLTWDDETVAMRAPPAVDFDGIAVVPPPGAFLQATGHGQACLTAAVGEAVGDAARVADLFSGCGTFALPLARRAEVLAVEGDAAMLAALDHGWRHASGLKAVRTLRRDLFRNPLMPDELRGLDAVVLDPPRAGAEAQVLQLAQTKIPRIAYVSCNPVSFARDAAVLVAAGYRLHWVQVVDQFRWSAHIELAACFTLPHIRA